MKNIFILLLTCLVPLTNAEAMVRLKEVYQKGAGGTGTIKVEFNGNYKESKAELAYKSDSVEIMMRDAFTIPANRTFKVSSDKSSVSRIIAKQTPGNMVKLILYFRIPIDVIQKTAKIVVEDNVLNFTYKTSFNETIAQMPQEETIEQKEKGQEQEQPATIGTSSMAIDQKSLEDNGVDELIKSEQPVVVRSYSKHLSKLLAVLKGAVIVLLVIAFSVGVFYLYKRYSFGMMEKMSMTFGRKEMKISGDEIKVQ